MAILKSRKTKKANRRPAVASKKAQAAARARLRGSVLLYDRPLEPVFDPAEWDVNK